jgi:hypothetical protein
MTVDWNTLVMFIMGVFFLSGFSRGWWKEALTTGLLAILVLFLQNPTVAETVMGWFNWLVSQIWSFLPASMTLAFNQAIFGAEDSLAPQLNSADPGTWLMILGLIVVGSVFFGRTGFTYKPTVVGKILGAALGLLNGFLVLSLAREYLDGRALPGGREVAAAADASAAGISIVSDSGWVDPIKQVTLSIANMPTTTILDNVIPWLIVGGGLIFLVSVARTRVRYDVNKAGAGRLIGTVPPFYNKPASAKVQPNPPITPVRVVEPES